MPHLRPPREHAVTSTITTLSGQLGRLLASEPSDAAQLADLASALNVMREGIRCQQALERIDWLLLDLRGLAQEYETREALDAKHYHEQMRRRA